MSYLKSELLNNFNIKNPKPFVIVLFFRCASYFAKSRYLLIRIFGIPVRIMYRLIIEWGLGVELPESVVCGYGLTIHHGVGLVVNPKVVIGNNVTLKNNTTLGCLTDINDQCIGYPEIGNNVLIHPHCIIFGAIRIGDNVIIGAGSVVNKDIPSNCIAAGNPAKVIKYCNENTTSS